MVSGVCTAVTRETILNERMNEMRLIAGNILGLVLLFFASCTSYDDQKAGLPDAYDKGTIHISADESFKPVIDAQIQVYESNNPDTHIIAHYKPEAECLKDLLVDSIRMVIATRYASQGETDLVADSLKMQLHQLLVARDAIAVIVNPASEITHFTNDDIRQILQGNFNKKLIPVFDGVKATSTVRFIIDSVLRGGKLTPDAVAARSSEEVIDYIARTKDAVGLIGVSWIANPEDPEQLKFLEKVKLIPLESKYNPELFVKPLQANIFNGSYPMVRDLVYMLKEKHRGLGTAFAQFLREEKGQLIFKRAYLMPAQRYFGMRKAVLNEK